MQTGGRADKLGNRYEGSWVVCQLLRLVPGSLRELQIEAVGDDAVGVDLWVVRLDGTREAQQCKRTNATAGRWTIADLARRSVLTSLQHQLARDPAWRFAFISSDPAPQLRELTQRAQSVGDDCTAYIEDVRANATLAGAFTQFCTYLGLHTDSPHDQRHAFDLLRRTEVDHFGVRTDANDHIDDLASAFFDGANPVSVLRELISDPALWHISIDRNRLLSALAARHIHERSSPRTAPPSPDFSQLDALAHGVDDQLLKHLRASQRLVARNDHSKGYRAMLSGFLGDSQTAPSAVLASLRDPTYCDATLRSMPEPDLTITVDATFASLRFEAPGLEAFVPEPELLWPCNCQHKELVTSLARSDVDLPPCPIHSRKDGEELTQVFSTGLVKIVSPLANVLWQNRNELWPPSADAFAFTAALKADELPGMSVRSIMDIGCGTGYLGIAVSRLNTNVRHIAFTDWLISPLLFTSLSCGESGLSSEIKRDYLLGLDTTWPHRDQQVPVCDVLVCNPPYLPVPRQFEHLKMELESAVAGTDLLERVIRKCRTLASRSYVAFSNVALPEAQRAADESGATLKQVACRRVPFRLPHALKHPSYVQYLLQERGEQFEGAGLKEITDGRFWLWHDVGIWRVN